MAWLLSGHAIPEGLALPEPLTVDRLREYVAELVKRLRGAALPG